MNTIKLNDFELNLLHGLLTDEEIRLKKAYNILSGHEDIFENTKKYIEEVNKLRKKFTEIDDTEDYFEVFNRIEDNGLDTKAEMEEMKYRKKPVEIEAIKYEKEHIARALDFCNKLRYSPFDNEYYVDTLEGFMRVTEGDFIIKGVNGEFYPCKPDIFEKTYEKLFEVEE
ncbi:MAG: hypothetical protein ACLVEW_02830 [Peptoniphilus sp.]|uniref:hypothetical protein n=1 Tax=Peptoniphilus sp. TaxID=1971214 RepID=UPI003999DB9A